MLCGRGAMLLLVVAVALLADASQAGLASATGTQLRRLQAGAPAPSQTPATDPRKALLNSIQNERDSSGPAYYKTGDAALYLTAAMYNVTSDSTIGSPTAQSLYFKDGGRVQLMYTNNSQTVIMPFVSFQNSSLAYYNSSSDPLMSSAINREVMGYIPTTDEFDPFTSMLSPSNQANLAEAISMVTGGVAPKRIVCTGFGPSGGVARMGALWSAFNYPQAAIRLITFGAPQLGSDKFNWAVARLVGLNYIWTIPGDNTSFIGNTVPYAAVPLNLSYPTNQARVSSANVTWDNYLTAINYTLATAPNQTFVTSNSVQRGSRVSNITSDIEAAVAAAVTRYRGRQTTPESNTTLLGNLTYSQAEDNSTCPLVLCKARPASTAACNVYNSGNSTIEPGSLTITEPRTDTTYAVAWLGDENTAVISFRGSVSRQNWITDFQVQLSDDSQAPVLEYYFPGAAVHSGFLNAFQSVSTDASSPQYEISHNVYALSGGDAPSHVIMTGHSLGAALATLGSVWASLTWPEADVTGIVIGSPLTGNYQWTQAYKTIAGAQFNFAYQKDIVPSIPPLPEYTLIANQSWAPNPDEWVLEERQDIRVNQLNWDDHACQNYQDSFFSVANVSAPNWVTTAAI